MNGIVLIKSTLLLVVFLIGTCFVSAYPIMTNESTQLRNHISSELEVIESTLSATSLAGNIMGESEEQPYIIYLPQSYHNSSLEYPVIYMLHGFSATISFFHSTFQYVNIQRESIIVIGSGHSDSIGGTFYTNSPITGNWEDFIVNDLVSFIDANYRTLNESKYRGIAGFSVGGYGALNIAMKHPDVFGSVWAISPGLFNQYGINDSVICEQSTKEYYFNIQEALNHSANDTIAHTEYLSTLDSLSSGDSNRFMLAYGSAFSPNTKKRAPYIDYLYYNDSGTIKPNSTAWMNWNNGFGGIPPEIDEYRDNLLNLRGIGIEYSSNDYYHWITDGCRSYSQKLVEQNITHCVNETSYGHSGSMITRIDKYMMPFFAKIFGNVTHSIPDSEPDIVLFTMIVIGTTCMIISVVIIHIKKIDNK